MRIYDTSSYRPISYSNYYNRNVEKSRQLRSHRFVKGGVEKRKKHAQASGLAWVSMEKEPNMKVDHACVKKKYLR